MNALSALMVTCLAASQAPAQPEGKALLSRKDREDLFAFAEPPKVTRDGGRWVITFASKANCDATVAVVDQGGKIVRHLASGVLGSNAPRPFQRDSLSQRLVWDGLTDESKKAPDGCKVRVSLGLKPRFDRALGWSAADAGVAGLAVDPDGRLLLLGRVRPGEILVRAFDREGRYLRTVMPHPAGLSPERMTLANWTRTATNEPALHWTRVGGSAQFNLYFNENFCAPPQTPVVTADGRLVFVTDSLSSPREGIGRVLVFVHARDGAAPEGSVQRLEQRVPGEYKFGPLGDAGRPTLALSPDGKSIYLAGLITRENKAQRPIHAVFRAPLDKPGMSEPFLGQADSSGSDNVRFNGPRGLACDFLGNLYVADWGNDRIQVFRSDGAFLKTVPCPKPDQVAVHPKTGEIYVLSTEETKDGRSTLLKLGALENPGVRIRLDLAQSRFCLDTTSDPPAVWVGGRGFMNKTVNGWEGAYGMVWRLVDRGDRFEKVVDLDEMHKRPDGWPAHWPTQTRAYITADPYREELYVRDGNPVFASPILRIDGRSGKVIDTLKPALTARVGPDRRVYLQLYRYGHPGQWLARYDPDTRSYLTFPENTSASPDGKTPKGWEDAPLGPFFIAGARRGFQVQPDVAPNGDIYMPVEIDQNHTAEFEKEKLSPPAKGFRLASGNYLLQVFSSEGRRKSFNILPGLRGAGATPTIATVRVGPTGAVYWAAAFRPLGAKVPDGIASEADYPNRLWGTLLKFDSTFDAYPVGRMLGSWEDLPENAQATHMLEGFKRGIRVENVLWEYPGMSAINGGCTCMGFSFDLDRFERIFVPAVQTCSVNVLDGNGNLILRVGGYGNADSLGPSSPVADSRTGEIRPRRPDDPPGLESPLTKPEIGLIQPQYVTATDEAIYVVDGWNRRIVRAAIDYAVQELVPLP